MQINKKVKLQKQTKDGTISMTIPKQFVDMFNWVPGDVVTVTFNTENEMILTLHKD